MDNSSIGATHRALQGGATRRALATACAAALALALAACGGGTNTTASAKALWVANGANVVEFTPSQTMAGAKTTAPHLVNASGVFGAPQGVVFDAQGDLWVIDGGTLAAQGTAKPALYKFTPTQLAQLATTNNPMPAATITSASFTFPQQAVFDARGNLWVTDNGANAVYQFSAAQVAAATTGDLVPNIALTSNPAFAGPLGIAFDRAGDLFIANNGATTIYKFLAAKLPTAAGAATLTPDVTLNDNGSGSISAPWGLMFDAAGNLWSSNADMPQTMVKFAPASLMASGSPTPIVTIATATIGASQTLVAPNGVCFDPLGNLAVIDSAAPFGVPLYSPNAQQASGAVAPDTFLVGATTTLDAPAGCVFGPVVN